MPLASTGTVPVTGRRAARARPIAARLTGLAIVSVLPAIFWSVLIDIAAKLSGSPLDPTTVMLIFAGIASFLGVVCAPLVLHR